MFPLAYGHQSDHPGLPDFVEVVAAAVRVTENKSLTYGDASVAEKYENGERKRMKQTVRIISIGWLNPLLSLHLRPINLVVSQDPLWPKPKEILSWE